MKRTVVKTSIGVLLMAFLAACGLLQEPEAPSGTLEAVPLDIADDEAPTEVTEATETGETSASEEAEQTQQEDTEPPSEESMDSETSERIIFSIDPAESLVRFELDEDLSGIRNTVVGATNQVVGEIALDLGNPSSAQVGIILINARTLVTDNEFRNRAIQNRILSTGEYEYIEFAPSAVEGLPDTIGPGETVKFTIVGDLTVRDVTKTITFDVEATMVSESEIVGTASGLVSHDELGLSIPEVPRVANVEEEVELYIDFVARSG